MRKPKYYYNNKEYKRYILLIFDDPYGCEGCKWDWHGLCKRKCRYKTLHKRNWKYYRKQQWRER